MELTGNAARNKTRIIPRNLQLVIRNDEEVSKLLSGVIIAQDSVLPNIQTVLLPPCYFGFLSFIVQQDINNKILILNVSVENFLTLQFTKAREYHIILLNCNFYSIYTIKQKVILI